MRKGIGGEASRTLKLFILSEAKLEGRQRKCFSNASVPMLPWSESEWNLMAMLHLVTFFFLIIFVIQFATYISEVKLQ